MKRILILNGAARRNGKTDVLVHAFTEGADHAGNEIREIQLQDKVIHECLGCQACARMSEFCVQKDDMEKVYEGFLWADVIVFASPIYFGGITGTLKIATDRLYSMWMKNGWRVEKECAMLLTANSPIFDQALMWYSVFTKFSGWKSWGEVLGSGKTAQAAALGASIH